MTIFITDLATADLAGATGATGPAGATGPFGPTGVVSSGWTANTIIYANSTGYFSNTESLNFYEANTTLITGNVEVTGDSTSTNSALKLSGTPYSTGAGTNHGVLQAGPVLGFNDTNIIASWAHDVNGYAQMIMQNKNSGAAASADFVVNNDRVGGTAIYGDFGINSSGFTGSSPFNDPDGTYIYGAGGSLTIGTNGAKDLRIAVNDTLRANVNTTTGTFHVHNDLKVLGNLSVDGTAPGEMRTINFIIDGGGSVITTGPKGNVMVDFTGTIEAWSILGDVSGSLVVDVSKATYTNFPTFTASGGTSPTLSSQQKNYANTITWTGFTTVSANDILRFAVSGTPSTVTLATVSLKVRSTT